jgi:hypothetical protein
MLKLRLLRAMLVASTMAGFVVAAGAGRKFG